MERYGQPTSVESETEASSGQRNTGRDSLFLAARLRVGDDSQVHQVRVRNLSEGGLMAEYPEVPDVDTPVEVEVRGLGWIVGRIAWATAGRIGIAFSRPVDPKRARKPVGLRVQGRRGGGVERVSAAGRRPVQRQP